MAPTGGLFSACIQAPILSRLARPEDPTKGPAMGFRRRGGGGGGWLRTKGVRVRGAGPQKRFLVLCCCCVKNAGRIATGLVNEVCRSRASLDLHYSVLCKQALFIARIGTSLEGYSSA